MGKYFAKRIGMACITIFLVTCITFLLMNAVPGSPWLSEKTPSAATLAALNAKYGLDKPVHIQLLMYLKNLLKGDFGVSLKMQKNRAVLSIILEMFPGPLHWESSLSFIPIILRFGLLPVFSCIFKGVIHALLKVHFHLHKMGF